MVQQTGILSEGARRVWRHQRVLRWFFIANFVLAAFATVPVDRAVGRVADHSLYSQRLYQGFDLSAFSELAANPEVALWSKFPGSVLFALIFFVFALFLTGGILETYRTDRKLVTADFFHACGACFWRWVRLLVVLLIVLVPITIAASGLSTWSDSLSHDASQERLGFWVEVAALLFVTLLLMAVRLWFDMAQVHAVAEDERAMLRAVLYSFRLTCKNFRSLYWMYFRISFLAWLGLAAALLIWIKIPSQRIGLSFSVLEIALLWWTGTRLWQRASETVWYERRSPAPAMTTAWPEPYVYAPPAPAASSEDQI
ncbi:MAG: hypothetical protein LAN83_08895 [Acidobacteriia bacterium]|nr:hypothetical protein [Terriglobia bacterium]